MTTKPLTPEQSERIDKICPTLSGYGWRREFENDANIELDDRIEIALFFLSLTERKGEKKGNNYAS